jgi:energy-coupling factor transport system ATP-binding protein
MIQIRNIMDHVLNIESLALPRGRTTVIGKNGSGKTTLLRLCAGISIPKTGSVMIDGRPPREIKTGWVNEFPDRNILFSRVYDEIASPLRFRHDLPETTHDKVCSVAELVGIKNLLFRRSSELSGGEKVLVALSAALVSAPEVIVLDEYDSHVDHTLGNRIDEILRSSGCDYILQCTQQMETAATSDYLVLIDRGNPVHAGSPAEVFPHLIATAFYPVSWRVGF